MGIRTLPPPHLHYGYTFAALPRSLIGNVYSIGMYDLSQRRKDVNGALFVVKRNNHARFQFIFMNRRGPDNLVEDLLGYFEYEAQVPYLLYRNAAKETHGIWFYIADECQAAANLFGRILNAYSQVPSKSTASSSRSNECVELETVQTSEAEEGRLELSTISSDPVSSLPDDPSMNLLRVHPLVTVKLYLINLLLP